MFNYDSVPALATLNLYTTGSDPPPAGGREEVDEHMARHIEAGWKLALNSTNATRLALYTISSGRAGYLK